MKTLRGNICITKTAGIRIISCVKTTTSKSLSSETHNYNEVYKFVTQGGIRVSVGHGNIALQDVDAIVSDSNPHIMRGGLLELYIFKKGGPDFIQLCREAVKLRYFLPLTVGEVISVWRSAVQKSCACSCTTVENVLRQTRSLQIA
ncbi:uncharacterized protein LOC144746299 [Ciona intestinalis]